MSNCAHPYCSVAAHDDVHYAANDSEHWYCPELLQSYYAVLRKPLHHLEIPPFHETMVAIVSLTPRVSNAPQSKLTKLLNLESIPLALTSVASCGAYFYNNVLGLQILKQGVGAANLVKTFALLSNIMKSAKVAATLEFTVVTSVSLGFEIRIR